MRILFSVLATAILLNLASAPLYLNYFAMVGLLPLFFRFNDSPRQRFFTGWLAGFATQAFAYPWIFFTIRDFGGQSVPISLLGAGLFHLFQGLDLGLWLWLSPLLCRSFPKWAHAPLAAALFLLIQTHYPSVFPWQLGALLGGQNVLGQSVGLLSSSGLAFLLVCWQAWLSNSRSWPRWGRLAMNLPLVLVLAASFYPTPAALSSIKVAVIQPNMVKWAKRGSLTVDEIFQQHYLPSLELAVQKPDLIIWPESALAFSLDRYPYYLEKIHQLTNATGAALITGTIKRAGEYSYYNEIRLYQPGRSEPQIYRKEKLVLFSESLPWILSWARLFDPALGGFKPGEENKPFEYKGLTIVPLVCFEALFAEYVSSRSGNLMVNVTNDSWFGETSASRQHLQHIQQRSQENRIPLVRATNSGISCWIDTRGEIRDPGALYRAEALVYQVPIPAIPRFRPAYWSQRGAHLVSLLLVLWASGVFFKDRFKRRGKIGESKS